MMGSRRSNADTGGGTQPRDSALAAEVEAAWAARARGEDRVVEFGRYRLVRTIGRGGMGQVFEAWDPQLERHVAIKLVLRGGARATLDEARCLARLAHPNVVSVHEVGWVGELAYIAMELVDGPDLRAWLRERARTWEEIVEIVLAAGRGLAAVHDAGLLHGDIKPGNVLIGRDGRVRVADFGLARGGAELDLGNNLGGGTAGGEGVAAIKPELDDLVRRALEAVERDFDPGAVEPGSDRAGDGELALDELRSLLAGSGRGGHAGGTIPYMAPERLDGGAGGPAADQYSLCVTAWEALFGVLPDPDSDSAGSARATPRASNGCPAAVQAVLRRGLAEHPRARWASMRVLCSALEQARDRPHRFGRALAGRALGMVLTAGLTIGSIFGSIFGIAEVATTLDPDPRLDCERQNQVVWSQWGPAQRAALELRFAASELSLPRSEARFVIERLDAWVETWAALWSRSCVTDPGVRRCLEREQARLEAVLALLDTDSTLGAGRALVAELGSPTICLDAGRGPSLDAAGMGRLAELSAIERRIELAALAGAHQRATDELRRFDAVLLELEAVATPAELALRRLAVEPLRARVLTATGDAGQARVRLRMALREAEARGRDDLRFALLLAQTRLTARLAVEAVAAQDGPALGVLGWAEPPLEVDDPILREPPSVDDLAALDGLAERVHAGSVARAELGLIRAGLAVGGSSRGWLGGSGDHRPLIPLIVELQVAEQALEDQQPHGHVELRLELALRRAQLHFAAGELDAALRAAEQARTLGQTSREQFGPRVKAALTIAAVSAALLGDCDRVGPLVEALWRLHEQSDVGKPEAPRGGVDPIDWVSVRRACPYAGGDLYTLVASG